MCAQRERVPAPLQLGSQPPTRASGAQGRAISRPCPHEALPKQNPKVAPLPQFAGVETLRGADTYFSRKNKVKEHLTAVSGGERLPAPREWVFFRVVKETDRCLVLSARAPCRALGGLAPDSEKSPQFPGDLPHALLCC